MRHENRGPSRSQLLLHPPELSEFFMLRHLTSTLERGNFSMSVLCERVCVSVCVYVVVFKAIKHNIGMNPALINAA